MIFSVAICEPLDPAARSDALTDEQKKALLEHNMRSFGQYIASNRTLLQEYARTLTSLIEAEDLLQEAIVAACKAFNRHPQLVVRSLDAWFHRILQNTSKNRYREATVMKRGSAESLDALEQEYLVEIADDERDQPEAILMRKESQAAVAGLLLQLPRRPRQILMLYLLKDWSAQQIAESLGITLNTVKSSIRRGVVELREIWLRSQVEQAESGGELSQARQVREDEGLARRHPQSLQQVADLSKLREPYRTVVDLRLNQQLSLAQIAKQLGRPVNTVKSQLQRSRKPQSGGKQRRKPIPNAHLIRQLQEPYRTTLLLYCQERLDLHEIASRCGISISGVRSRVARGTTDLKALEVPHRSSCASCPPQRGKWIAPELLQYVHRLPTDPPYHTVIDLHYCQHLSTTVIAAQLGRSVNTVKSWMRRGGMLLECIAAGYQCAGYVLPAEEGQV